MNKMTVGALYQALQIAASKREAAARGEETNYGAALVVYQSVDSILRDCPIEIEVTSDMKLNIANMICGV